MSHHPFSSPDQLRFPALVSLFFPGPPSPAVMSAQLLQAFLGHTKVTVDLNSPISLSLAHTQPTSSRNPATKPVLRSSSFPPSTIFVLDWILLLVITCLLMLSSELTASRFPSKTTPPSNTPRRTCWTASRHRNAGISLQVCPFFHSLHALITLSAPVDLAWKLWG